MSLPIDEPSPPGFWQHSYWSESRTALASLVFVAPLLIFYEVGVLLMGPGSTRNGADVWLRQLLDMIGLGQYFFLPVLTVAALLSWHHLSHEPWRVSRSVLNRMPLECAVLAIGLFLIAQVQTRVLHSIVPFLAVQQPGGLLGYFGRIVGFIGAGIYEELLFRLLLIPVVYGGLRALRVSEIASAATAVVVTSTLFSLAHYLGPMGDSFTVSSFLFRFIAGAFFGVLFATRGFGIAAGTHAAYDLLVGVLLAPFF